MYIHLGSLKELVSLRIVAFGVMVSVALDVLWVLIFWGVITKFLFVKLKFEEMESRRNHFHGSRL